MSAAKRPGGPTPDGPGLTGPAPHDIDLDLLLVCGQASGVSVLRKALHIEPGLAAIRAGRYPGRQCDPGPVADRVTGVPHGASASRSPPDGPAANTNRDDATNPSNRHPWKGSTS